jgi:hypothetical protein
LAKLTIGQLDLGGRRVFVRATSTRRSTTAS